MTQLEFETKYLGKTVRIKGEQWPDLKGVSGFVTAALLDVEDYPLIAVWTDTKGWITFELKSDLSELTEFEIV